MKPAAAYYRMSSDAQEASIPAQRDAVEAWAKANGWRIVATYADEGISGDDTARRAGFQRMISDAPSGRFCAIIVWDLARLGRFDSLEGGYWLYPLRQAGVQLITLDRGPVDWSDFGGRVVWAVEQEGRNAYLRTLSRDVLRGKLKGALAGRRQGGRAPIGYRYDSGRLVIDPATAPTARRIFAEYLAGSSLRAIAERLNSDGVPAPRGRGWQLVTIRSILRNRAYLGEFIWGAINAGRYSRMRRGSIEAKASKAKAVSDASDTIRIEGAHEALIDPQTFAAVQVRLSGNRHNTTPHAGGGGFLLSGLLWCAHCGHRMIGSTAHGHLYWICSGYSRRGRSVCQMRRVTQADLIDWIIGELWQQVASPEAQAAILSRARAAIRATRQRGKVDELRRAHQRAAAEVERLEQRLCEVESRHLAVVQSKLDAAIAARDAVAKAVAEASVPAGQSEAAAVRAVAAAAESVESLRRAIEQGDTRAVRQMLRDVVSRVTVRVDAVPGKSRGKWLLKSIEIQYAAEVRSR